MALVQKKISEKKQIKLILMLILIIGITLAVVYFGLLKKSSTEEDYNMPDSVPGQDQVQDILIFGVLPDKNGFEQIKELIQGSVFTKLEQFGAWPLSLDPKGKTHPFVEKKAEQ
jgi:hypothetical protein